MDRDSHFNRPKANKETLTFASFSAAAHREIIHNSKEPTFFTRNDLLGHYVMANGTKSHYLNELVTIKHH